MAGLEGDVWRQGRDHSHGPKREPGGFTTREILQLIRRLCAETPIVGTELVEVAPGWDPVYTTALAVDTTSLRKG